MHIMMLLACGQPELVAERDALQIEADNASARLVEVEAKNGVLTARVERQDAELDALRTDLAVASLGSRPIPFRFITSEGTISCTLWPEEAPQTVLNFVELAKGQREWVDPANGRATERPFYDGTTFHRVIPGFMIQGGDPLANGQGGPGYRFKDEITERGFDEPGLLAMANSGPNTNGSQFFITEGTPEKLNGKHTIFGSCSSMATVKAIARVPSDNNDKPSKPVVVERVAF
jgi:peptidyl-prolyl cis-trans isomerase A (cyclophilin A)